MGRCIFPPSFIAAHIRQAACQVGNGAEKVLADAQLVDLPDTGGFVLPLAAHGFLVGLLVLQQVVCPSSQALCSNNVQTGYMAASRTGKYIAAGLYAPELP